MTDFNEIYKICVTVQKDYRRDLQEILDNYFLKHFIIEPRPWKAVLGNKQCKPIAIHRDFSPLESYQTYPLRFNWPKYSYAMLTKELIKLGFVVYRKDHYLYLCTPQVVGHQLTYAQKKVREINRSYGIYCAEEKKKAKKLYSQFLDSLVEGKTIMDKIYVLDNNLILFKVDDIDKNYELASSHCKRYFNRMMTRDGISFFQDSQRNLQGYLIRI